MESQSRADAGRDQRMLEWDAAIEEALCHEDIVTAARDVDVQLAELRAELVYEDSVDDAHSEPEGNLLLDASDGGAAGGAAPSAVLTVVRRQLLLAIERRMKHAYALTLPAEATTELVNQAFALRADTSALRAAEVARLRGACSGMVDGGCLGIVGPVGAGKTWLLTQFCGPCSDSGEMRTLSVIVPAVTPGDKLDFVKDLLVRLCDEVLLRSAGVGERSSYDLTRSQRFDDHAKVRWNRFGAVISWGGATLILLGALGVRADPLLIAGATCLILAAAISRGIATASASDSALRMVVARLVPKRGELLPLIGVGVALIAASQFGTQVDPRVVAGAILLAIASAMRGPPKAFLRLMRSADSRGAKAGFPPDLVDAARSLRERLDHSTTIKRERAGGHEAKIGKRLAVLLRSNWVIAETITPEAFTYPGTVNRLEAFVQQDAKDVDVRIGIDLRRMDPERSQTFLEEIDDVLQVRRAGCFVIVALLGDSTEVATLRKRCDEVVALPPLSFSDSHGLLGRNGVGLPIPFAALCHVLSGGIPRTLREHAHALVVTRAADNGGLVPEMSHAARALMVPGLQHDAEALLAHALRGFHPRSEAFLDAAHNVRTGCSTSHELASHARHLKSLVERDSQRSALGSRMHPADDGLEQLVRRLAAHCDFAAAVLGFFDDSLSRAAVDRALTGEPPPLEMLREARWLLELNPGRASRLIRDFRMRCALDTEGL
jgi:hypothetical protein